MRTLGLLVLFAELMVGRVGAYAKQFQGLNGFQYLDRALRQDLVHQTCQELAKRYAAWEYKKAVIGVDGAKLCEQAEAFEKTILDPKDARSKDVALQQAKLNTEFWDRYQKLGASFRDTHLTLDPAFSRAQIVNGIKVQKVGNQVRVTECYPAIVRALADGAPSEIPQAGDELVSVNEVPAITAALQLQPWISGSSEPARLKESVRSITQRSFRYATFGSAPVFKFRRIETQKTFEVKVRYAFGAYQSPANLITPTSDAIALKALGIKALDEITYELKNGVTQLVPTIFDGMTHQDPLSFPTGVQQSKQYTLNDSPVLRLSRFEAQNRRVGYAQLRVFAGRDTPLWDQGNLTTATMTDVLLTWIKALDSDQGDLVLDLRYNAGGDEALLSELLGMLVKPGSRVNPPVIQVRVSSAVREDLVRQYEGDDQSLLLGDLITDVLLRKQKQKDSDFVPLTEPFRLTPWIEAQNSGDGFHGHITVITGPECVSTCESLVRTLMLNRMARIVGEPSAGTGVSARYRAQGVLDVAVGRNLGKISFLPTELIGAPQFVRTGESKTGLAANYNWAGENRPAPVDYRIEVPRDVAIEHVTDFFLKQLGLTPKN